MAIVFDCPHCGTNYRLKDEVGGKTATCKNPNCRKVIHIPQPIASGQPSAPADLDAFAAAAFSDESNQAKVAEVMIPVTCSGCDHVWQVEASKEGKNVLCPECRRPNRVPLRKKTEKADWRSGAGGPSLAKKETGLDRQGAFGTGHIGGISDETARKIVKERDAQEEPEERRKKWLKRGAIAGVALVVIGVSGFFLLRERKQGQQEGRMEEALAELKGPDGTKDLRHQALIHRASGEYRLRSAHGDPDIQAALADLKTARNLVTKPNPAAKGPDTGADRNAILAEIAMTMGALIGSPEQVEKGERLKKEDVIKDLRLAVTAISDPELSADVLRALTRSGHAAVAEDVARQLSPEMLGQIGLELLRTNSDGNRNEAEAILAKTVGGDSPSVQGLRLALGKTNPKSKDPVSAVGAAEAAAIQGDVNRAKSAANGGRSEEKVRALVAAAQALVDKNPTEAAALLDTAVGAAKGATVSPWVTIRICRLLARVGKFEPAEALAASMSDDQARSWARLEILRGRMSQASANRADDSWLAPVGDPVKLAAAAKAHEEIARHNARVGAADEYQKATVSQWTRGSVRPFGIAGLILGRQDQDLK